MTILQRASKQVYDTIYLKSLVQILHSFTLTIIFVNKECMATKMTANRVLYNCTYKYRCWLNSCTSIIRIGQFDQTRVFNRVFFYFSVGIYNAPNLVSFRPIVSESTIFNLHLLSFKPHYNPIILFSTVFK